MKLPEKKKLILPVLIVLVLASIVGASFAGASSKNGKVPGEQQSADHGQTTPSNQQSTSEDAKEKTETDQNSDPSQMPTGEEWKNRINNSGLNESGSQQNQNQNAEQNVVLPYTLSAATLQVQRLAAYSGVFIEDGSDEETDNVAAILVKNTGDEDIELAWVDVKTDAGKYSFQVTSLPAGASAIVMDQKETAFSDGKIESITATATDPAPFELSEDQIEVVSSDGDEIVLKNISDKTIPTVRVFYKFYYPEQETYVGGITYTASVQNLEPGKTATLRPFHYSGDAGRIVMIRTYEDEK